MFLNGLTKSLRSSDKYWWSCDNEEFDPSVVKRCLELFMRSSEKANNLDKEILSKSKIIRDERPGDVIWHVPDTTHLGIINLPEVRKKAYEFLTAR